jgi:IS30 family transposase
MTIIMTEVIVVLYYNIFFDYFQGKGGDDMAGDTVGREEKLNDDLIDDLEKLISEGHPITVSCDNIGIARSTFYLWMRKGKQELNRVSKDNRRSVRKKMKKYVKFYKRMSKAKSYSKIKHLKNINSAADKGNWKASAWYLERLDHENFGRKQTIEGDMKVEKTEQVESWEDLFDDD